MREDVSSRGPYELLAVIRKVVNYGITSDLTYQTMVNVKALHEVRQTAMETIVAYVERLKGARDAFLSTSPHGVMFQAPDMMAKVVSIESMSGIAAALRMRMLAGTEPLPPPTEKVFAAADLTPVVVGKSWVTDAYMVRIAITGINDKNDALKAAWRTRILDENGSGPTIPANLEDLLQRVLQYEAMDRQFMAGEIAGVKSTMFRG